MAASSSAPPFSPTTRTYNAGAATDTVPSGAAVLLIKVWAPGGGGGRGSNLITSVEGGGGGGGGYVQKTIVLTAGDWGTTFNYSVGGEGAPGVSGAPIGGNGGASTVGNGP